MTVDISKYIIWDQDTKYAFDDYTLILVFGISVYCVFDSDF